MRIIPAIDILDGKCVRLTQGDYNSKKVYNDNPVEVAKRFADVGVKYLHVVDLDGAKSKHIVNKNVLKSICDNTNLKVDFGGGLKSQEDIDMAFEAGAHQVTVGSLAVSNPSLVQKLFSNYGSDKIILGADFLNRNIATSGWTKSSQLDILTFIKSYETDGAKYVICTDISKDGLLAGPSMEIYKEILSDTTVNLIASGGIRDLNDIAQLKEIGCEGAIIGKAIYEGNITLAQIGELC